ncbi:fatty-acid amide hydrolase 1-like isoform X4 [Ovis aries]|uniref:fatty-acid amide hydrolase 1-like isoform X4 n=1 Tax=Ovis aries TaxID=9940 RepID=UPI00295291BC|nr:fatty-acid amide hydrolase 1-like isoform X4 [Ovis aries]
MPGVIWLSHLLVVLLPVALLGAVWLGATMLFWWQAPARSRIPRAQKRREEALRRMAALAERLRQQEPELDPKPILELPLEKLVQKLLADELSLESVLCSYLEEAMKVHQEVNCLTDFLDECEEQLQALKKLKKSERGLLYGVPISLKDVYDCMVYSSNRPLRIGYYESDGFTQPSPSMARAVKLTCRLLRDAGHQVIPFSVPRTEYAFFHLFLGSLFADEGASLLEKLKGDIVDPSMKNTVTSLRLPDSLKRFLAWIWKYIEPRVSQGLETLCGVGTPKKLWELHTAVEEYQQEFIAKWRSLDLDVLLSPALDPAFFVGYPAKTQAHQASLFITISRSSLRFTSIESMMLSSHLILCRPLLLLPPIPPTIRVFSNESTLRVRWPKYWSVSFSIIPSKEHPGLISFRMDWLDLLAVQGTLKSLLQHHSSKASILWCSAFFTVQLSHPYMTTGKTIALTRRTLIGKVMSLLLNILSRLVITFLPRSKPLLISWLQSPSAVILEPPKIKSDTVSTVSPSISHDVMGPDAMIFVF